MNAIVWRTSMMVADCVFLLMILPVLYSFPLEQFTGSFAYTSNHKQITSIGIRLASAIFIENNNLTNNSIANGAQDQLIDYFFEDDPDGKEEYSRIVDDIIAAVERQETSTDAYIHCNSEQFTISHNHIQKLRKQIKDLKETSDIDYGFICEMIGQCIYTIQAFYSTSNWIEMTGATYGNIKTYKEFGMIGRSLMAIAGQNEDTCEACDNSGNNLNSCKNNLLVTDRLTSGYQTGQDIQPPIMSSSSTRGKCGFGGSSDTKNGERTVTGGINKDRTDPQYSPHHHLHVYAAMAARIATKQFLIDSEIGLVNEIGNDMYGKVFNLEKRHVATFGFVIDVTGSMSNNIAQVIKASVDIITNVLGTKYQPKDFVLCTFSDPKDLTARVKKTTDGLEMISTLEKLTVDGGHDCPEFAMDGLLKCIPECRDFSTIFFYTDAPAKDEGSRDEVINAANDRNIDLQMFLEDDMCVPITKRSYGRSKRSTGADVFLQIAEATGGKVYQIKTSELADVMKSVTEELFPSSTAVIDFFNMPTSGKDEITFPIDTSCNNFKVTINGATSTGVVDVISTTGSIMLESNTKLLFQSPSKVVVTVLDPSPGVYTVRRLVKNTWDVNITTQSAIDVTYKLLELDTTGSMYRLRGNPIVGKNYGLFITVFNIPENCSVDGLILSSGVETEFNLTEVASEYEKTFLAMTTFTETEYKVTVHGTIDNNGTWKRSSPFTIKPVDVELLEASVPDLYAGHIINVTFTISNKGSQNETFIISITDNRGLVVGETRFTETLQHGGAANVVFQIQGSSLYKTVTYEASVRKSRDVKILQQAKKTIYISPDIPPSCSVDTIDGYCGDVTLGNMSCSDQKWTGKATVTYSSGITSLAGTNGLVIAHDNISSSPIEVSVSGDCCTPSTYLNVIDKNNHFVRCHFFLGDVKYEPKPTLSTVEKVAIGMIAGIVVAGIVGLTIFCVVTYRAGVKPKLDKLKIDTLNIKAMKDLPEAKDKVYKGFTYQPFYPNHPPTDTTLHGTKLNDVEIIDFDL